MIVKTGRKPFIFGIILLALLLGGAAPAFSSEALVTFALGYESSRMESMGDTSGMIGAVNLLFVNSGGLAVSGGIEFVTPFRDRIYPEPVIGIGYVFYRGIYFGGLLNVIPRTFDGAERGGAIGDGLVTPTLVAGLDFGSFLVEARASYIHGFAEPWNVSGFRFSLGVGMNVGNSE